MFISHILCLSWFLIFCLFILSSARRRIVKSVTIIIELYIYSFDSGKFLHALFMIVIFFWWIETLIILKCPYLLQYTVAWSLFYLCFVFFLPFTFKLPTLLPVNYLKNVCILFSHSYLCENRNPGSKKGNASTRRHNKFYLHKGKNCSSASNSHKKLILLLYPEDR